MKRLLYTIGSKERQVDVRLVKTATKWNPQTQARTHEDKGELTLAPHHLQATNVDTTGLLQDMQMPFKLELNIHLTEELKKPKDDPGELC